MRNRHASSRSLSTRSRGGRRRRTRRLAMRWRRRRTFIFWSLTARLTCPMTGHMSLPRPLRSRARTRPTVWRRGPTNAMRSGHRRGRSGGRATPQRTAWPRPRGPRTPPAAPGLRSGRSWSPPEPSLRAWRHPRRARPCWTSSRRGPAVVRPAAPRRALAPRRRRPSRPRRRRPPATLRHPRHAATRSAVPAR